MEHEMLKGHYFKTL